VSADASWTFAPGVLGTVGIAGTLYVVRWRHVRRDVPAQATPARLVAFMGGLLAVLAALVSPVDRLADQVLTMHMVQHLLLLDVAPILVLLGFTRVLMRPLTRRVTALERRAGLLAHPAFAVFAYVGVMWLWHVPTLYDAALNHDGIHVLEHLAFALAGGLYWWHLVSPVRGRLRLGGLGPATYMASTKLLVGLLGIVLTFAPHALYDFYVHAPRHWGLTPAEDQSVAGLVMALEQSITMGIALAWLFARMLGESEREEQRAERFGAP
jgi:cytochrome c oxidase assembly factor CtaG